MTNDRLNQEENTKTGEGTMRLLSSRRSFLTGTAALFAGGALAAVPSIAQAHSTNNPPSDVDMLNYALTLEHLEYAFYRDGLKKFNRGDFESKKSLPRKAYPYFERILEHEDTHVDKLTQVIESLNGTPVPEATYNFKSTAFTSLAKFISVAQFLENTGVSAYDGAIAHIETAELLTAGATIATVEARHASYLNLLNGDVPFPESFDEPVAPRAICRAVLEANGGFISDAPEPYGPYPSIEAFCESLPDNVRQ